VLSESLKRGLTRKHPWHGVRGYAPDIFPLLHTKGVEENNILRNLRDIDK
jgi:hypothetical protein